MPSTTYVIGAGVAGLSAAVRAAERGGHVVLIDAAKQAGGRCRSYFDPATGLTIDNGNHLVASGNHAVNDYLALIGAADKLTGHDDNRFDFADLASGRRWTLRPNAGRLPWWMLSRARRVPGSRASDYLKLLPLMRDTGAKTLPEVIPAHGPLWDNLLHSFFVSALNTPAETASAKLAGAIVRETLAAGGAAYRPRLATPTLAAAFVDPALEYLRVRGGEVRLGTRLRAIGFEGARAAKLHLGGGPMALGPRDRVVIAVPPWVAAELLPCVSVPDRFHAIVNAHFACAPPPGVPQILGTLRGTAEWVIAHHDRVSVTVSAADALAEAPREAIAATLWSDVQAAYGITAPLPAWQVIKENRATFAATPEQDAKRPGAATRWANVVLAGDWTQTGLPATIEGAVRSGVRAVV